MDKLAGAHHHGRTGNRGIGSVFRRRPASLLWCHSTTAGHTDRHPTPPFPRRLLHPRTPHCTVVAQSIIGSEDTLDSGTAAKRPITYKLQQAAAAASKY